METAMIDQFMPTRASTERPFTHKGATLDRIEGMLQRYEERVQREGRAAAENRAAFQAALKKTLEAQAADDVAGKTVIDPPPVPVSGRAGTPLVLGPDPAAMPMPFLREVFKLVAAYSGQDPRRLSGQRGGHAVRRWRGLVWALANRYRGATEVRAIGRVLGVTPFRIYQARKNLHRSVEPAWPALCDLMDAWVAENRGRAA
jgi:hypothetical protein